MTIYCYVPDSLSAFCYEYLSQQYLLEGCFRNVTWTHKDLHRPPFLEQPISCLSVHEGGFKFLPFFNIWTGISGSLTQMNFIANDDLELLKNFYYIMIFFFKKKCSCHSTNMEVRGQHTGASPRLSPRALQGWTWVIRFGNRSLHIKTARWPRCPHIKTARWPKFELVIPLLLLPKY